MNTMRQMARHTALHTAAAAVLAALFLSCSGGGGGGGGSGFVVSSIDVPENSVQRINRPIHITFSEPVNFSTVNLNTINIREVNGAPSAGTFVLGDSRTVVFQQAIVALTVSLFIGRGDQYFRRDQLEDLVMASLDSSRAARLRTA